MIPRTHDGNPPNIISRYAHMTTYRNNLLATASCSFTSRYQQHWKDNLGHAKLHLAQTFPPAYARTISQ